MIKYHYKLLEEIKVIKSYLIEFEKDDSMKSKVYLKDCAIGV